MDVIHTENLCKSYGPREVLHDVNLSLPVGGLIGFLGPNGAGKSTTIRILLGLLRASSGRAKIFGQDCWREGPRLRAQIGYLPGEPRFYGNLTGRQTLDFLAAVRRVDCASQIARLQKLFDLDLTKRVRNYSSGMKQKLGLMQALMHRPQLLILDEPTNNLDPLVRQSLYDELRAVARADRTTLFSSHTLSEVDALCDAVAILRDGRLVEHEQVEVLRRRAVRHVEIVFDGAGRLPRAFPEGLNVRADRAGRVAGTWSGPVDRLLGWLAGESVRDVAIAPPDLEELFFTYYADGFGDPT